MGNGRGADGKVPPPPENTESECASVIDEARDKNEECKMFE